MHVNVHFLPGANTAADLMGRTVVVIDILRATTTMVSALSAGARAIIPCLEVEEARKVAGARPEEALLGGERGGVRIPGFHLGNSPAEFTRDVVSGKTVVMTTTNGTRALQKCRAAKRVLIGAFVNFTSVLNALQNDSHVSLLCAGTDEFITREDVLFAGAIVSELRRRGVTFEETNDEAEVAASSWLTSVGSLSSVDALVEAMRGSRGGRNLQSLGYDADIRLSAQIDSRPLVAELDLNAWEVRQHC